MYTIIGFLLFLVFIALACYVYYKGFFKTPNEESIASLKKEKRNHVMKLLKSERKKNNFGVFRKTKKIKHGWKKIHSQM